MKYSASSVWENKDEYDVRVIIPKYACMKEEFNSELRFVCHFYVHLGWRRQYVGIFESEYQGIKYYFVDNEFYKEALKSDAMTGD